MQLRRIPAIEIPVPVVTSNGAIYASGDQIGVVMKLENALQDTKGMAFLRSIIALDKSKQKAAFDVFFFNQAPVNAVADNSAADISDAEMAKCLGSVSVVAGDYADLANSSLATKSGLGLLLKGETAMSKDLWILVVSRGTPTYTSVQDLTLKLALEQC